MKKNIFCCMLLLVLSSQKQLCAMHPEKRQPVTACQRRAFELVSILRSKVNRFDTPHDKDVAQWVNSTKTLIATLCGPSVFDDESVSHLTKILAQEPSQADINNLERANYAGKALELKLIEYS